MPHQRVHRQLVIETWLTPDAVQGAMSGLCRRGHTQNVARWRWRPNARWHMGARCETGGLREIVTAYVLIALAYPQRDRPAAFGAASARGWCHPW